MTICEGSDFQELALLIIQLPFNLSLSPSSSLPSQHKKWQLQFKNQSTPHRLPIPQQVLTRRELNKPTPDSYPT
jgi:hypothetical protein